MGTFHGEGFSWRGKYPDDKLSRRYFTLKIKFVKILTRNYFYFVLLSLCRLNFTCEDIKRNRPGEAFTAVKLSRVSFRKGGGGAFSTGKFLHGGVFHGTNFSEGTFCVINVLLGGEGGGVIFAGKLFHGGGDF